MKEFKVQISCFPITDDLLQEDKEKAPIGHYFFDVTEKDLSDAKHAAETLFLQTYKIKRIKDFDVKFWIEV